MSEIDLVRKQLRNNARFVKSTFTPFKIEKSVPFAKANVQAHENKLKDMGVNTIRVTTSTHYIIFPEWI